MIMVVVFDGNNYHMWERVIETTLRAKKKIGLYIRIVDETDNKGEWRILEAIDAWEMANSMLCSWLLNVIDPKLRMSIAYSDTSQIMWEDMRKRYAMANTLKVHQLKANIANCEQSDLNIGEFYSKLTNSWNEPINLMKVPVCKCSGSTCGVVSKIISTYEEDKAHQFLMGLNDD